MFDASIGGASDGRADGEQLAHGPHRRDADRRGVRQHVRLHDGEQLRQDARRRRGRVLLVLRARRDGPDDPGPAVGVHEPGPRVHDHRPGGRPDQRVESDPRPDDRDRSLNGEWYVVFGSGPTGPIDNTNNQFLGRSNQNLRFFVLDLKTGALVQTIDTGIPYAFAGSMINSVADFELDYQDDAIYVGYVKKAGSAAHVDRRGVGRILTEEHDAADGGNRQWAFSKVIDGVGPVTSAVVRLQSKNFSTNWLFFGTGRYFFEIPATGTNTTPDIDDADGAAAGSSASRSRASRRTTRSIPTAPRRSRSPRSHSGFPNVTSIGDVPTETIANSGGIQGLVHRPGRTTGTTPTTTSPPAVPLGAGDHRPARDHLRRGLLHDLQAVRGRVRPRRQELPVGGPVQYGGRPRRRRC